MDYKQSRRTDPTELMVPYSQMLYDVRFNGIDEFNERTGKLCRLIPGYQLRFDCSEYFPLLGSRQIFPKGIIGETVGFFRGATSAAEFRELGCNFWDANANKTQAWLDNPYRKGEDDLGPVYGAQWTKWQTHRIINRDAPGGEAQYQALMNNPNWYLTPLFSHGSDKTSEYLAEGSINQLAKCLDTIINNPSDRRIIYTGWNPGEIDMQALPACHMDYRWIPVTKTQELHLVMTIRSWDLFLGGPTNIASGALQLAMMAKLSGYKPGTLTIQAANAHIYEDHFDAVDELFTRPHPMPPTLHVSDLLGPELVREVGAAEVWNMITPGDFLIEGYEHGSKISAPMAA